MTAGTQHLSGQNPARKSGRAVQAIVIILSLISVAVFRVVHDKQLASDSIKYADMHDSVNQMSSDHE